MLYVSYTFLIKILKKEKSVKGDSSEKETQMAF